MDPPFPERIHFIIRHSHGLRVFKYIVIDDDPPSDYSVQLLRTCIAALEWSGSKPSLSIATRRPILGEPLADLLLYINSKFALTRLDVLSEGTRDDLLQFLAQFRNLEKLQLWNFESNDHNEHDMDRFFRNLPLRILTLHETMGHAASFPHQLEILNIGSGGTFLTKNVWVATCNLTNLALINIECDDIEEASNEEQFVFRSSNLQTLSGSLTARTEAMLTRQIILPIYAACQHLTSLDLHINSALSSTFLTLLLSKETLVNVNLSSEASPYRFQDFLRVSKILKNLRSLQLPWPATIGCSTNDAEGLVMDWRFVRDHSQDVPERLTFDRCQELVKTFPNLNMIEFEMDTEQEACSKYWTSVESIEDHMQLDGIDIKLHHATSFKMATFIDSESLCLNLCSELVCFPGSGDDTGGGPHQLASMRLILSLNQIRKHAGTPYQLISKRPLIADARVPVYCSWKVQSILEIFNL